MQYAVYGRLEASICDSCTIPFQGATVRLYRYDGEPPEASLEASAQLSRSKDSSFSVLDPEAVAAKEDRMIAESEEPAGEDGSYEVTFGEESGYEGGPLQVDIRLTHLPGDDSEDGVGLGQDAVQLTVGYFTFEGEESSGEFNYRMPENFYCKLLESLGRWVICGHVLSEDDEGLAGAEVQALDADVSQDDPIGTATTNSAGRFLIYYTKDDFDDTPVSFVELELIGGPDCYFKVDYAGQRIYDEDQADGRQQGRENRGHCTCVTLRSEEVRVDVDPEDTPVWTSVYEFDIRTDLTSEGYTADGNHHVFGGAVPLRGNVPLTTSSGDPLKYRFLAAAWDWPGGSPTASTPPSVPPSKSDFQPVTDIARTRVGTVIKPGFNPEPVYIDDDDLDPDGFVTLQGKSVEIQDPSGSTQTVSLSKDNFVHALDLMRINTRALTPDPIAEFQRDGDGDVLADQPPSPREPVRRYRLRFQVFKESATPDKGTDDGTLDSIVFDNTPIMAYVDLEQLANDLCAEISGSVDVEYTADHPHLKNFDVVIKDNAGTVHDDTDTSLPDQEYNGSTSFRGGHGTENVDVSNDDPCAYEVILSARTRHHPSRGPTTPNILYRIC